MKTARAGQLRSRGWRLGVSALTLALLSSCGTIRSVVTTSPNPNYYSLAQPPAASTPVTGASSMLRAAATAPTLIVSPPHSAAGFDSRHIMYVRHANQLEFYAYNEWVDTPARMLAPLIVTALERSGAFRAVVQTPSAAAGEMRLDTEILRLQHEFLFTPSRVRFTLRAYLVETATRRVIATREFEAIAPAPTADPHGGVIAAGKAVQTVLDSLAAFCAEAPLGQRKDK